MKSISNDSSEKIIGTTEVSRMLGVSPSTVRRLADQGDLKCIRVGYNQYRKFKQSDVLVFKDKNFKSEKNDSNEGADRGKSVESKKGQIKSKSHPAHYLMHKYWGRKPHNVVASYIKRYTKPGEKVLDPFAGSGMTVIEAIKNDRYGIGIDINPMSKFIALNTVRQIDLEAYEKKALEVLNKVIVQWKQLYETICPVCKGKAQLEVAVWDHGKLKRIKGRCSMDGIFIKDADSADLRLYKDIAELKKSLDMNGAISYPKDKVLKYVKRSGKESIDELFTDRALIILSYLRDEIFNICDTNMRELLLFTFTSMLANVSNMLPGDLERATYKSGWVISKFWTPKVHTERSIFHCFRLRVRAIKKGKSEVDGLDNSLLKYEIQDSSNLSNIESESIDYIFTDPPYGESIAYLALSQFWNSWLEHEVDYKNEIIIDPNRNKGHEDYAERMYFTFRELYRVLKDKHYLSFTFHNRDLNVWKAVIDGYNRAGFELVDIILQEQAVSSGTQGINKNNTLTGDFVYTLQKDKGRKKRKDSNDIKQNAEGYVKEQIANIIESHREITPTSLYEKLIPLITKTNSYTNSEGKVIDIEKILKDEYEYVRVDSQDKLGGRFAWKMKEE